MVIKNKYFSKHHVDCEQREKRSECKMKELELNVIGMHCTGCENRIKKVVSTIKNVKEVQANHETGKVNIIFKKETDETVKDEIRNRIENLDFKVQ